MRFLALALFLAAPAAHADAEAWRGVYGGFGLGGGNARSTWVTDATFVGPIDEPVEHSARGAALGVQYGYRRPISGSLLLGVELAWYAAHMEERGDANITGAANRERVSKVLHPLSLALQLGIAPGSHSLVYVRGGFAYARIELQAINHQVGNVATWEGHGTGWTAGAGFEYKVRKHWSLGFEYDYAKLRAPDMTTVNSGGVTVHSADFKTRVNLFLLRANYLY